MERALKGADGETSATAAFDGAGAAGAGAADEGAGNEDGDLSAAQRDRALRAWLAWKLGRTDVALSRLRNHRLVLAETSEAAVSVDGLEGAAPDSSWVNAWCEAAAKADPDAASGAAGGGKGSSSRRSSLRAKQHPSSEKAKEEDASKLTPSKGKRAERQQRRAAAVAGLLGMCPTSAVSVALVREHLRRFRDDLILPSHLASDDQPFGMLIPTPEVV
jgi:hypothetical protein